MKGGIGCYLYRDLWVLWYNLMFLSQEFDIKLCQRYTNTFSNFQIRCVFAENDLFKTFIPILHLIYISFGITLTQFYINFSWQEHQKELIDCDQFDPKVFMFQPIPLSFFLNSCVIFYGIRKTEKPLFYN